MNLPGTFESFFTKQELKKMHQMGVLIKKDLVQLLEPMRDYKLLDQTNVTNVLRFDIDRTNERHYAPWELFTKLFSIYRTTHPTHGNGIYRLRITLKSGEKWGVDLINIHVFEVKKLLHQLNNSLAKLDNKKL